MEVDGGFVGCIESPINDLVTPPLPLCRIRKQVEVDGGFVGCIESLAVNSSRLSVQYDLNRDSSTDIVRQDNICQSAALATTATALLF